MSTNLFSWLKEVWKMRRSRGSPGSTGGADDCELTIDDAVINADNNINKLNIVSVEWMNIGLKLLFDVHKF
jgi:hypothetical protein